MANYTPIIGLEIHLELKTASKMFCGCSNDPEAVLPNTNVCPVCLAHPGSLPVPNAKAIVGAIKIAHALGCTINTVSKFDRKNYFYPDLPKGYQISQYDQPIGEHGKLILEFIPGKNTRSEAVIGITRVHLEEDTGKLQHLPNGETAVDFNRAGVPLVEIVSDPDIQSGAEAKAYCQELRLIFRTLGVSDADMEKGQMRCEVNISLQTEGAFIIESGVVKPLSGQVLNPKVEVKNINSFRAVEKAVEFEITRQTVLLNAGTPWQQETRGWSDEGGGKTTHQRYKETAADYRYFPEPDIPPFHPAELDEPLPELPQAKRRRFNTEYGFSVADAELLAADPAWANYTEAVMSELVEWLHDLPESKSSTTEIQENKKQQLARLAGGWLTSKLTGAMAERSIHIRILKLKPENFAELIALIFTNRVNSTNAQKILLEMLDSGVDMDPTHLMEEKGYGQVSDATQLGAVVLDVMKNYPAQVAQFKAGKEPIIKFLMGMAMKSTEGSADPVVVERLLREQLAKPIND